MIINKVEIIIIINRAKVRLVVSPCEDLRRSSTCDNGLQLVGRLRSFAAFPSGVLNYYRSGNNYYKRLLWV